MHAKQITITLLCFVIFFLAASPLVQAQTIAVFPLEDLSVGENSPNWEVTRYIAGKLALKGLNVIQEQDIINFMATHGINWLGYLRSEDILKAGEQTWFCWEPLTVISSPSPMALS